MWTYERQCEASKPQWQVWFSRSLCKCRTKFCGSNNVPVSENTKVCINTVCTVKMSRYTYYTYCNWYILHWDSGTERGTIFHRLCRNIRVGRGPPLEPRRHRWGHRWASNPRWCGKWSEKRLNAQRRFWWLTRTGARWPVTLRRLKWINQFLHSK